MLAFRMSPRAPPDGPWRSTNSPRTSQPAESITELPRRPRRSRSCNLCSVGKRSATATEPTQRELEVAHCWEADDRVPGRPAMTAYRRRLRYHQSQWREAHGHPIGTQPMAPRPGALVRLVGSRLPLDYGRDTGANFLTDGALAAARARTSITEPHQSFD